ncbi:LOW QUALITY PROTEIN: melanoma antigen preferentially expressed in tumors-like [Dugong dugon]
MTWSAGVITFALPEVLEDPSCQPQIRIAFGPDISMNSTGPPRLLDLVTQNLLQVEAWAIAALESLPTELFLPLFTDAVAGRHSETLKAMVQAWPFTHLPLGALMKAQQPHQDILKVALDGLDVLLAQKIRPRRWKLKVLDLRVNANTSFWNIRSGIWDWSSVCSLRPEATQPKTKRQKVDDSRKEEKQLLAPVQVLLEDLCLQKATPDEFLTFFMKRAKQRKGLPHLCCRKLEIVDMPLGHLQKILKMVQLDCVQEVEVNGSWDLFTLAREASFPIQLSVAQSAPAPGTPPGLFFLEGHLDQVLRCLKTPLVTLLITNCLLLEPDLTYLSSYLNTSHLRYLNLSDVNMMGLSPEFLQLTFILPALGHCSQLTSFSFRGNPVSMAALESLLWHTVLLSKFRLGLFPVPLKCYVSLQGTLDLWNLRGYLAELRLILQDLRQPNAYCSVTVPVPIMQFSSIL